MPGLTPRSEREDAKSNEKFKLKDEDLFVQHSSRTRRKIV